MNSESTQDPYVILLLRFSLCILLLNFESFNDFKYWPGIHSSTAKNLHNTNSFVIYNSGISYFKKYQPYFEVFLLNLVEICPLWNGFREEFKNQVYRRADRRRTTHDRTTLTWSRFCSNCYLGPLVGFHERLIVQWKENRDFDTNDAVSICSIHFSNFILNIFY